MDERDLTVDERESRPGRDRPRNADDRWLSRRGLLTAVGLGTVGAAVSETLAPRSDMMVRASSHASATPPWIEEFDQSAEATSDDGETAWAVESAGSHPDVGVQSESLAFGQTAGIARWVSDPIDISAGPVDLSLAVRGSGSLSAPPTRDAPGPIGGGPAPTDPDLDGIYEDTTGDGAVDAADVRTLLDNLGGTAVATHLSAFDGNCNGRVDYDDAVRLAGTAREVVGSADADCWGTGDRLEISVIVDGTTRTVASYDGPVSTTGETVESRGLTGDTLQVVVTATTVDPDSAYHLDRVAVTEPPSAPEPADGWTEFELAPDAKRIYVSNSEGDDANSGSSLEDPLATPAAGVDRLEGGDWLLFKRGDTFEELPRVVKADDEGVYTNGPDASHPTLVGAYGDLSEPRPTFRDGGFTIHLGTTNGNPIENFAWVGLRIYNQANDPDFEAFDPENAPSHAFSLVLPGRNLLFEDVKFEYGQLSLQAAGDDSVAIEDVRIRRSVFVDSWSNDGHAQGLYSHQVDGLTIEECVFDHNGYHPDAAGGAPTKFNHNVYIQSTCNDVTFRNNVTARASSHGFQARPHGLIEGNLSIGNYIAGFVAADNWTEDAVQVMRGNVAMHGAGRNWDGEGDDLPPWGFDVIGERDANSVENDGDREHKATFVENVVAHSEFGVGPLKSTNDYEVTTRDNVVYDWGDEPDQGGPFPDQSRTVADYHASIGGAPSMDAFLQEARKQRRGYWREAYTAAAAVDYLQAGFIE